MIQQHGAGVLASPKVIMATVAMSKDGQQTNNSPYYVIIAHKIQSPDMHKRVTCYK
jgi:hypothetical protein